MGDIEDEDLKAKGIFDKLGVNGFNEYAKGKLAEWENTPVNLAIVGESGAGKSTFINKLRNMGKNHPNFAKVGVTQTTWEPKEYEFPNNKQVKLWDIPGAGTKEFKISDYAEKMEFKKKDAFIILSACRFTENDSIIAAEIEKMGKPFYFARTKMDFDLGNAKRVDEEDFSETDTRKKITEDCQNCLGQEHKNRTIYLLGEETTVTFKFPDNEKIKTNLLKDLPAEARTALVLTLAAKSDELLTAKVEVLQARIKWVACLSGFGGAIPVPGLSMVIDWAIVATETRFQLKQLGIDGASMKKKSQTLGMNVSQLKQKIKDVAATNSIIGSMIDSLIDTLILDIELLKFLQSAVVVAAMAAEELLESTLKFIPIVGSVAGAIMSATSTGVMLCTVLKGNDTIARACLTVLNKD